MDYPQEYLDELDHVASRISARSYVSYYEKLDVYQFLYMKGLENYHKYMAARGEIGAFLSRLLSNKLRNLHRDLVRRNEPPCPKCITGTPCQTGFCLAHRAWDKRNNKKADLSRAASCAGVSTPLSSINVEQEAERSELIKKMSAAVPPNLRLAYQRLLNELPVSDAERGAVYDALRSHFNE